MSTDFKRVQDLLFYVYTELDGCLEEAKNLVWKNQNQPPDGEADGSFTDEVWTLSRDAIQALEDFRHLYDRISSRHLDRQILTDLKRCPLCKAEIKNMSQGCVECGVFYCIHCHRWRGWTNGAADNMPNACDDCHMPEMNEYSIWFSEKDQCGSLIDESDWEQADELSEQGYTRVHVFKARNLDEAQTTFARWVQTIDPDTRKERVEFFAPGDDPST